MLHRKGVIAGGNKPAEVLETGCAGNVREEFQRGYGQSLAKSAYQLS